MRNYLKNVFRDKREAVLGYVGFFGSIITAISAVIAIYQSNWETGYVLVTAFLIAVNFFLGMLVVYTIRRYDKLYLQYSESQLLIGSLHDAMRDLRAEIESGKRIHTKVVQIFHNFTHEYRKVINEIHSDLTTHNHARFEDRNVSFEKFMLYMLSNIKEVFDILTGDECSACIKILDEKLIVRTLMRDSISYRERSIADSALPSYFYSKNTAFREILDPYCPDAFYLHNELSAEHKAGRYDNSNPKWEKFYNACIVVPIRIILRDSEGLEAGESQKFKVLGFICVDNRKGGFNAEISVNVLASFADSCYHLLRSFYELKKLKESSI